jgi:ATP-dependent DNA ligase
MISRKLDGVRVISYLNGTQPIFFSRTGTIFTTLGRLNDDVINILKKAKEKFNDDFVLDGECCLIDENGKEDFNEIMKQITRKNFTIIKPVYILFDLISKKEFDSRKGETIFKERMKKLEELEIEKKCNFIKLVEHKNAINEIDYKE